MPNWSSQLGQDKFVIEEIFKNKKNGTFVEVGAHDGEFLSNTKSLEKYFSWTGVCVEPSRMSSDLVKRRKSKVFNVCVGPVEFENQIVRFRESSSAEISETIFKDLYEPPHYAKKLETKKDKYWDRLKKCKTLDSILDESNLNNIDYISIDIQGSEWLAIKDFPFNKWNVGVFTIANDMYVGGRKEENRNKTKSLMEDNGYELKKVFTLNELDRENWGKNFEDKIIEDLYIKQDG
jgi:FkbM family methyltransferase